MVDAQLNCPHCGKASDVPPAGADQAVQCPQCQKHFRMVDPAAATAEGADSVVWEAIHGRLEKKKMLLVDDDDGIRHIFKRMLTLGIPGIRVDEAANGNEAVEAFSVEHHDIIIMDLHMPVMDGHEAFLRIEALCKAGDIEMPSVIFCTGYSPPGSIQKIVADNPAHALLLKPTTEGCILNAVKQRL